MILQKGTEKAIEEFMEIVTLMELDRDDGTPLYKDGDMRIGAKKKHVDDFIKKTRREAVEEAFKATKMDLTHEFGEGDKDITDGAYWMAEKIEEMQDNYLKEEK